MSGIRKEFSNSNFDHPRKCRFHECKDFVCCFSAVPLAPTQERHQGHGLGPGPLLPSVRPSFPHLPSQVESLVSEPPKDTGQKGRGTGSSKKPRTCSLWTCPPNPPQPAENRGSGRTANAEGHSLRTPSPHPRLHPNPHSHLRGLCFVPQIQPPL